MKGKVKKESSTVAGNLKGFSAPFGAKKVKRKRPKKNPSKPYGEPEMFEAIVAKMVMEDRVGEVVKKRGSQWVIYDDDTGAELGSFPDRETAWEKQRQIRRSKLAQKKSKGAERKRQVRSLKPQVSKKNVTHKGAKKAPDPKLATQKKKKKTTESLKKLLKKVILSEAAGLSYVFEQSPISDESLQWEQFIEKLSKQTLMSDTKLRGILQKASKAESKVLEKSASVLKKNLEETQSFEVQTKKFEQDPKTRDVHLNLEVQMKDNNRSVPVSIKVENGRPLIVLPEETRQLINSLANDESKLFRAELVHIQETAFDLIEDVAKVTEKRDSYLKKVQGNLQKFVDKLSLLEIAMLKDMLKNKYRGV